MTGKTNDSVIAAKLILVTLLTMAFVILSVGTSVWAGTSCFIDTGNMYIGLAIGLTTFIVCMSARDWLTTFLYSFVFSYDELIRISKFDEGE